jgi:hypothetical protein
MEGTDSGGEAEGFGGPDVVCALAHKPEKAKRIALNNAFVNWHFFCAGGYCLKGDIRSCSDPEFPFGV